MPYIKDQGAENILKAKNHYVVLGIDSSADRTRVKKAYRELALKYHPDKTNLPNAKDIFHRITLAYETLSDDNSRDLYDQHLKSEQKVSINRQQFRRQPEYQYEQRRPSEPMRKGFEERRREYEQNFENLKEKQRKFQQAKTYFDEYLRKKEENARRAQVPKQPSSNRTESFKRYKMPQKKDNTGNIIITLVIFALFWYFLPKFSAAPDFVLTPKPEYTHELKTTRLNVPYYVKPENKQIILSHEKIQQIYIRRLQNTCQQSLTLKKQMETLAVSSHNSVTSREYMKKAKQVDMQSCKKIVRLLKKHPEINLSKFANLIGT